MTTHIELFMDGDVEGLLYAFDRAGEGLGMHDHQEADAHEITVLKGKVVVYGDLPTTVIPTDMTFRFDWSRQHEVVAIEDGTVIFNRFVNGIPAMYRNIPPDKRRGSVEDTLHNAVPYHLALTG